MSFQPSVPSYLRDKKGEWRPPNEAKCVEAFTVTPRNFREQPNVQKLLSLNTWGAYTPKLAPSPGDWLALGSPGEDDRVGQTFKTFCNFMKPLWPNSEQRTITLVPVGPVDPNLMEIIREYTQIFFFGMDVDIEEELDISRIRLRPRRELPQLKTGHVYPHLQNYRRGDQFCVLGVTMRDLYPDENWNFVYGEAQIHNKIGLFSLCRHVDEWWKFRNYNQIKISNFGETEFTDFLLRSLETVAHEIGHLFGMYHCVYFECMMNGVNNDEERDRSPVILCPICQRKLAAAINKELNCFKPIERCRQLIEFFKKYDCVRQVNTLQNVLDICESNEALSDQQSVSRKLKTN